MATRKRTRFLHGVISWLLVSVLVLVVLGSFSVELFFVVALIGVLVVLELTAPLNVTPQWRSRLKWIVLVGLLVFAYIVVRRILAILPEGLL